MISLFYSLGLFTLFVILLSATVTNSSQGLGSPPFFYPSTRRPLSHIMSHLGGFQPVVVYIVLKLHFLFSLLLFTKELVDLF